MIIRQYNRLDDAKTGQLRKLEAVCREHDGSQDDPIYLETTLHYDKNICHTFIAYEAEQPVSFIHLFLPTAREAELTAMTLPERRGQGYFSALLFSVEAELNKYTIPDLLFVTDQVLTDQNKEMLEHLGAFYDFSEYVMMIGRRSWLDQTSDNGLTAVKAEYRDLEALTRTSVAIFDDRPEDARSLEEKTLLSRQRESFKALYNGKIIGMGHINYDEKEPGIFGLGIRPEYQQKGFGRRFLSLLLNQLFKRGASQVKLEVGSKNIHALNLYRNIGFETVSGYDYYRKSLKEISTGQELDS
jgi:Acetyltransferases